MTKINVQTVSGLYSNIKTKLLSRMVGLATDTKKLWLEDNSLNQYHFSSDEHNADPLNNPSFTWAFDGLAEGDTVGEAIDNLSSSIGLVGGLSFVDLGVHDFTIGQEFVFKVGANTYLDEGSSGIFQIQLQDDSTGDLLARGEISLGSNVDGGSKTFVLNWSWLDPLNIYGAGGWQFKQGASQVADTFEFGLVSNVTENLQVQVLLARSTAHNIGIDGMESVTMITTTDIPLLDPVGGGGSSLWQQDANSMTQITPVPVETENGILDISDQSGFDYALASTTIRSIDLNFVGMEITTTNATWTAQEKVITGSYSPNFVGVSGALTITSTSPLKIDTFSEVQFESDLATLTLSNTGAPVYFRKILLTCDVVIDAGSTVPFFYEEIDLNGFTLTDNALELFQKNIWSSTNPAVNEIHSSLISGWITGGIITKNIATPVNIDASAGYGYIRNWTDPTDPKLYKCSYAGDTSYVITGLNSAPFTELAVRLKSPLVPDGNGGFEGELIQLTGARFTDSELQTQMTCQLVVHFDFASITDIDKSSQPAYGNIENLITMDKLRGSINTGNNHNTNGTVDQGQKEEGTTSGLWFNRLSDPFEPITTDNPFQDPVLWGPAYRDGVGGFTFGFPSTSIDRDNYDDGTGVLATIPPNKWVIRFATFFGRSGNTQLSYGQVLYNQKQDAIDAITTENPSFPPVNVDGVLTTAIVHRDNADLSDLAEAEWFQIQTQIAISTSNPSITSKKLTIPDFVRSGGLNATFEFFKPDSGFTATGFFSTDSQVQWLLTNLTISFTNVNMILCDFNLVVEYMAYDATWSAGAGTLLHTESFTSETVNANNAVLEGAQVSVLVPQGVNIFIYFQQIGGNYSGANAKIIPTFKEQ